MDLLSAILFFVLFATTIRFWLLWSNHEKQIYRLVSNAESEKGTAIRRNRDFENRLRSLERRTPLKDDDQEDQQANR